MQTPTPLQWLKNWGRFWQALTNRFLGPQPDYPPMSAQTAPMEPPSERQPTNPTWQQTEPIMLPFSENEPLQTAAIPAPTRLSEPENEKPSIPRVRRKSAAKSLLAIVHTDIYPNEITPPDHFVNESGMHLAHRILNHLQVNGKINGNHTSYPPPSTVQEEGEQPFVNALFSETISPQPHLATQPHVNGAPHPVSPPLPSQEPIPPQPSSPQPPLVSQESQSIVEVEINGDQLPLTAMLESLLFVSDASVEVAQLARALQLPVETIEAGLQSLSQHYQSEGRGLRLLVQNGRYRLITTPAAANLIESFLNLDATTRLSGPALETLAVIAYRQPVTRAQLEAVRGVDCGGVLRSLLQRGLIEEQGRLETPGRPILYAVTEQFMQHFGLTSLQDLPPLETIEAELLERTAEAVVA